MDKNINSLINKIDDAASQLILHEKMQDFLMIG